MLFRHRHQGNQALLAIGITIIPIFGLLAAILYFTNWRFTYSLDDPYIHLALAKQIITGHYGINANELAAPSSSIVWPLLLAPFAITPFFEYAPLLINTICILATASVLIGIFAYLGILQSSVVAFMIMLALNIFGMAFNGMEHNLQILCVAVIASQILNLQKETSTSVEMLPLSIALIALPLVRYEGLSISVPITLYLFYSGHRRSALVISILIGASLGAFSLFLYQLGLGILPASILVKNFDHLPVIFNLYSNISAQGMFVLVTIGFLTTIWKTQRPFAIALSASLILHLCFGQSGWFGRYEVYLVLFFLILILDKLFAQYRTKWFFAVLLPLGFPSLSIMTLDTPEASRVIADQQRRLAEIVQKLDDNVAVNDIGLISLKNTHYTLDLIGLASNETRLARATATDMQWISKLIQKHAVPYVIVYDGWFGSLSNQMIKVGAMRIYGREHIRPNSDIIFYASSDDKASKLRSILSEYKDAHPSNHFSITVN